MKTRTLLSLLIGAMAIFLTFSLAIAVRYLPLNRIFTNRNGEATLEAAEHEFRLIRPLPAAREIRFGSLDKIWHGTVGADYQTDQDYVAIRAHYDGELRRQAWRFGAEKPVLIWRKDYGGKQLVYCKGPYTATLQTAGTEPGIEWTYSFAITWGVFNECG
jgi:hypothetical protein